MMSEPVHAFYPEESPPAVPALTISHDHSTNYAFQQNAVPVIKELHLKNDAVPRRDLVLRVSTEPAFATPAEIRLQSIAPDGEFRQAPVNLKMSHDFFAGLSEKVCGWLKVELLEEDGRTVQSLTEPVSLLARNEWCGLTALPEILAAFVMPNDPAVMGILGQASEILHESTGRSAINGYQDRSRRRAWEQVAAIHKAISGLGIRYINPPASFESTGQKVRFPSDIVSQRFGTCLDLALLSAACCEQAGLRPLVLIHEGHAYAGCWLEERSLPQPAGDDLQHIRKLENEALITVFEATCPTWDTPGNLNDAEQAAKPHLRTSLPFRLALDIRAARRAGIRPLPIPGQELPDSGGASGPERNRAGAEGLGSREFADSLTAPSADGQAKAGSRIDLWKSRLLDLSLRNRLLNLRETKATIRIMSAEPEKVEDALAGERELALLPKPRVMSPEDPRSAVLHTLQQRTDALADHLRDELLHGRLHTHLEEAEHGPRLTELYRAARNALDENGSNTLFAAVGILEWRETEFSDRPYQAPLLLVPVELRRKSVLEGFSLRRLDEETRLNVTLMEMLRQDFRKDIPGLDPLPEDDQGIDAARVLQIFRDAVRDMAGWEVKSEVWLGQFSFTKFLLWKDLTDRLESLTQNRIVNHLIHGAGKTFPNPPGDIEPRQLDDQFHPREIHCTRSADSSQLAAVMAAAAGHDFVLEGPPGTGKSQTIANIIAHCLSQGKRVLFVAEKRAALDVVHRRLREDGLEPFCLELHSNKTGKAEVLSQFSRSLKAPLNGENTDWERRASELEHLRAVLNTYTRTLHYLYPCRLTAYQCLDYLLPRRGEDTVRLEGWPAILETTPETLDQARQLCHVLRERSRPLIPLTEHPLSPLAWADWSPNWAEATLGRIEELKTKALAARSASAGLRDWLQFPGAPTRPALNHLLRLVESLLAPEPVAGGFITAPWHEVSAAVDGWTALVKERVILRAAVRRLLPALTDEGVTVPAESWSAAEAAGLFQRARDLETLRTKAAEATQALRRWLSAATPLISQASLTALSALTDSLLTPVTAGSRLAVAPWQEWSGDLQQWTTLAEEREELRSRLAGDGYNEKALLALDLDLLERKCRTARTGWFLPRFLSTGFLRRQLRTARSAAGDPSVDAMGGTLTTALRLRGIQSGLATVRAQAESLLGKAWKGGELEAPALLRVREWGRVLHDRLALLASGDNAWLLRMRGILAEVLPLGPAGYGPETPAGRLLTGFRTAFDAFEAARTAFFREAALQPPSPDGQTDHFTAIGGVLARFLEGAPRLLAINEKLTAAAPAAQACLGRLWNNGEPEADSLAKARLWGETLHSRMQALAGDDPAWTGRLRRLLADLFNEGPAVLAAGTSIGDRLTAFRAAWLDLTHALDTFSREVRLDRKSINGASDHLGAVTAQADALAAAWPRVREWCSWQKARQEALALHLGPVVARIESATAAVPAMDVPELFERSFRRAFLFAVMDTEPALRDFFGAEHAGRIERFRSLDTTLATLSRDLIHSRLSAGIPREQQGIEGIPDAEIGLLRKEIGKRARHLPVRQLLSRIPSLLPRLKPCVLMSPLSVAQYLEASHRNFDVVIFDEASQIPVWDAIGAIARGSQLIVVGDPKQLPPTNFFGGGGSDAEDEEGTAPAEHRDLESILDELMGNGLRHKRLQWHYRSRHEGLITFSNRQYYDNQLLTFPGPDTINGGVRFRHLPEARYDKGKSRTNRREAEALVRELSARLRDPAGPLRSFGVVTFSQAQQNLVENLLDEERRQYPEIEHHFGDKPPMEGEPVFVKNLENVQGDERDVILFSICYGPDESGRVSMNFGPLNRDGGERRLNVAITRAKHEVLVFSGLRADQIDLTRTRSRGVQDLKYFLDYAERGPRALTSATLASAGAEPDSEFERMVADRLRSHGYEIHHQVGCSGYRLDLAVVDPAAPGRYLLGVECDGATYHRAATARDRDKLRQLILEGLGWTLHRIWSTDWWHHADQEMEKLLSAIQRQISASGGAAPAPAAVPADPEPAAPDSKPGDNA
ncbi:MAG: DUF4011 domain-containing protein [Verrucomicrobiaceae bacterium]|nr:MAG: DUF4011 domain-containing protein [Verrucomicrobiaceae bacterium]